jgi:hypothetical protein
VDLASALTPERYMQLIKVRNHVHKDVRKQLYGDADDKLFFDALKVSRSCSLVELVNELATSLFVQRSQHM